MEGAKLNWKRKVFRLRGLPNYISTYSDVAILLSSALGDIPESELRVASLATTVEWEKPRSKVATLQFNSVPSVFLSTLDDDEWDLSVRAGLKRLTLDCHFLGLTPLNDVKRELHIADCIAISGLASHPFGSWQPRGSDKSFMWIRDEAPTYVSGMRTIVYGYDSSLVRSTSTQSIRDIARDFIENLRLGHWNTAGSRALVFVAHSLGGLVLKDALVQIADAMDSRNSCLLDKILGAIMLGVPNLGMEQSHLRAIVEGQPNETLVEDLSRHSNYLSQLDSSFSGITFERDIIIYWAYETAQSPTVVKSTTEGVWDKNGPLALLVSTQSATCRLDQKKSSLIFPINHNHSDMVKFPRNGRLTKIVCRKLAQICDLDIDYSDVGEPDESFDDTATKRVALRSPRLKEVANSAGGIEVTYIVKSLDAPDLNLRINLIEQPYQGTLEWVFDHPTFTQWLQSGSGIFWINGKPGSGKSTLMKFIFQEKRTQQLLHDWKRGAPEVLAGFFFNYRGSSIQKSFEGLLRSVLKQILSGHPRLTALLEPLIQSIISETPNSAFTGNYRDLWNVHVLEAALSLVLKQTEYPLDLFLFFDAVDEFDGHPGQISQFLKDLVEISATSLTRVKVCFSSRPWDIFKANFGSCPTFSVHEFTTTDIPQYCAGIISQSSPPAPILHELILDIVDKAVGVFLWVKLVVADLLAAAVTDQKSLDELRGILQRLPLELDDYYEHIIHRIPASHRLDTYVLLELVIRTIDDAPRLNLEYMTEATAIFQCRTYQEVEHKLAHLREKILTEESSREQFIRSRSGGLLEVQPDPDFPGFTVQVMHQTVFDFVTSLRFKSLVLGNLAKIIWENGHSFHFKYLCSDHYKAMGVSGAISHARLAETTTGQSQLIFLKSLPDRFFKDRWGSDIKSPLGLASHFNLILCIRDWVQCPDWLDNVHEPLLFHCCTRQRNSKKIPDSDRLTTLSLLLDNGYGVDREPTLFEFVLSWISWPPGEYHVYDDKGPKMAHMEMAMQLLDKGQDPNTLSTGIFNPKFPAGEPPLHGSPPPVARKLLDCGANPMATNTAGYTALDIALEASARTGNMNLRREWFILACVMAGRGVPLSQTARSSTDAALRELKQAGLKTNKFFDRLKSPNTISRPEGAAENLNFSAPQQEPFSYRYGRSMNPPSESLMRAYEFSQRVRGWFRRKHD